MVYRCRSAAGLAVAVKVLTRTAPEQRARFERERRLLGTLGAEEGFIPLLDAGTDRGVLYVVMPFVGGGTLRDRIKKGPLTVPETIALGRTLAASIGRAHALGIVHRDLKPENILFDGTPDGGGRPLIADLGIAKHYDRTARGGSQSASISQGSFRGTIGYMAPETLDGGKHVGPATDVFALGAILFECLTGERAFPGESIVETLARVTTGKIDRIDDFRDDVPPALEALIQRCLSPDPALRFADGVDLARALARIGAAARPRRARIVLASFAGTLALALAVVLVAVRAQGGAPRAPRPAPPPAPGPALPAPAPAPPPPARGPNAAAVDQLVEEATRAYLEQRFEDARERFDRAIELDSRSARAWAGRAVLKISYRDPRGALVDATRAIELDPRMTDGWNNRAVAKRELGDHQGALADFDEVVKLAPKSVTSYTNRAAGREQVGDLPGSEADFDLAIALEPTNPILFHSRALVRAKRGEAARACDDFDRFLELAPEHPAAPEVRAWVARNRPPRPGG